ncbi:MAG: hypothetical protein JO227_15515 [Acetobacteraceae bacterium]|nr:hypothetical protein [Acetobacteraceae bacterium]
MAAIVGRPLAGGLAGFAGAFYPFAVYFGSGRVPPGAFAALALALIFLRLRLFRSARPFMPALLCAGVTIAGLGLADASIAIRAYPIAVALVFAFAFGWSLLHPPSLAEQLASPGSRPEPAARSYLARVSLAWCIFLLINAALSAASWASGDLRLWTFYNGFASYVLIGLMFGGEYAVRRYVQRREAAVRANPS